MATKESLQEEMDRHIVRFNDKLPDWESFPDSKINRRAQFRYVGAGGGTPDRWNLKDFVGSEHFTVSLLFVPPGGGGALHGHDIEEVFFVLSGNLTVAWEKDGETLHRHLGPKDMIFSPAGHFHDYRNNGVEGAYLLIMLGAGRPNPPTFKN